jgi:hypothetical protein
MPRRDDGVFSMFHAPVAWRNSRDGKRMGWSVRLPRDFR